MHSITSATKRRYFKALNPPGRQALELSYKHVVFYAGQLIFFHCLHCNLPFPIPSSSPRNFFPLNWHFFSFLTFSLPPNRFFFPNINNICNHTFTDHFFHIGYLFCLLSYPRRDRFLRTPPRAWCWARTWPCSSWKRSWGWDRAVCGFSPGPVGSIASAGPLFVS